MKVTGGGGGGGSAFSCLGEPTPVDEQACISRQARGGVWGMLTCLFVRPPLAPCFLRKTKGFLKESLRKNATGISAHAPWPKLEVGVSYSEVACFEKGH